jgi:hypothetical protein
MSSDAFARATASSAFSAAFSFLERGAGDVHDESESQISRFVAPQKGAPTSRLRNCDDAMNFLLE